MSLSPSCVHGREGSTFTSAGPSNDTWRTELGRKDGKTSPPRGVNGLALTPGGPARSQQQSSSPHEHDNSGGPFPDCYPSVGKDLEDKSSTPFLTIIPFDPLLPQHSRYSLIASTCSFPELRVVPLGNRTPTRYETKGDRPVIIPRPEATRKDVTDMLSKQRL